MHATLPQGNTAETARKKFQTRPGFVTKKLSVIVKRITATVSSRSPCPAHGCLSPVRPAHGKHYRYARLMASITRMPGSGQPITRMPGSWQASPLCPAHGKHHSYAWLSDVSLQVAHGKPGGLHMSKHWHSKHWHHSHAGVV